MVGHMSHTPEPEPDSPATRYTSATQCKTNTKAHAPNHGDSGSAAAVQAALSRLDDDVRQLYSTPEPATRAQMLRLRQLIFDVAADTSDSGSIVESIKWGQASYATKPKTGSPLRIAPAAPDADHDYELLVVCTTTLIADFETMFPNTFSTDGRRVIRFYNNDPVAQNKLADCIEHALTLYARR